MTLRIDINMDDKYGATGAPAYRIYREFPMCQNLARIHHFRTHYDCKGRAFGWPHWFACVLPHLGGTAMYRVWGIGAPNSRDFLGVNVILDLRTLAMIADGCCPPAILLDYMSAEGAPD